MRRVSSLLAGLLIALCVLGATTWPLTRPAFTRTLAERVSVSGSGLPRDKTLSLAERVRGFVVEGVPDTLPATVDGAPAFDAGAVSHLRDVRRVLDGARLLTGLLAAVIFGWLAFAMWRKRLELVADAMRAAAVLSAALFGGAVLFAVADFERFFALFHSIFFKAGTWTFPEDSLLIRLFPEPFWAVSGAAWAALVALSAAALWYGAGRLLAAPEARASVTLTDKRAHEA